MQGTLNAHRLFRGATGSDGYLQNLDVRKTKEAELRRARDIIRTSLSEGMAALQSQAVAKGLIERRHVALAGSLPRLRPRFRMQGSAAYHTLNDPARKPPQEIDYDDGVYLPTAFVDGNGSTHPVIAARGFFKAVEEILEPVCRQNGWTLVTTKTCCVRVKIASDAHIDLPLYAIPDEDFRNLTEDTRVRLRKVAASMAYDEDTLFAEEVYQRLPSDRIMLAQRDGRWIESDARKIENWFISAINDHDESVRYVCRYYKGWRDFQWNDRRLTSLAIMACVVTVYDELGGALPANRDDTALLAVAERLPDLLAKPIPNPVIKDQRLDADWSDEERADFVRRARQLHNELKSALNENYHKPLAIATLQRLFGTRIPNNETLLSVDKAEREVLSYKPTQVVAPFVPRSKSG